MASFGNTKESLAERAVYREGDIMLNVKQYNLLIGGLLMWGFALNFLIVRFWGGAVYNFASQVNGGALILIVGYFITVLIGSALVRRDSPVTTFIGYNLIALPVGVLLCLIMPSYDPNAILLAVAITAGITLVFIALGSIFPRIFLSMGRMLGIGLIILIVGELLTYLIFRSSRELTSYLFAWLGAGLFAMFIGFDWARCNVCACTVNNAMAAAANLYLDIINLFIRILEIVGRRRR